MDKIKTGERAKARVSDHILIELEINNETGKQYLTF